MATTDEVAPRRLALSVDPDGQANILPIENRMKSDYGADLKIATKEIAHDGGMLFDDMLRAVLNAVA